MSHRLPHDTAPRIRACHRQAGGGRSQGTEGNTWRLHQRRGEVRLRQPHQVPGQRRCQGSTSACSGDDHNCASVSTVACTAGALRHMPIAPCYPRNGSGTQRCACRYHMRRRGMAAHMHVIRIPASSHMARRSWERRRRKPDCRADAQHGRSRRCALRHQRIARPDTFRSGSPQCTCDGRRAAPCCMAARSATAVGCRGCSSPQLHKHSGHHPRRLYKAGKHQRGTGRRKGEGRQPDMRLLQ